MRIKPTMSMHLSVSDLNADLVNWQQERIKELEEAISNISLTHQEPKDYSWYTECNGCGENLDKNKHDNDCPFIVAGIITQK